MKQITLLLCSILCLNGVSAQAQQHRSLNPQDQPSRVEVRKSVHRFAQAKQADISYEATAYQTTDYSAQYGLQEVMLTTDDFYFLFYIKGNSIVDNQLYTTSDMDTSNCYFTTDGYDSYLMDSISYKQYYDKDGGFHVTAFVLSGSVNITITYYRAPVPKSYDTINVTIPMAQMGDYRTIGAMEFYGYSADSTYYAQIDYACTDVIEGQYTEEDFDLDYCYMDVNNVEKDIVKVTADVSVIQGGYQIEAYFYCYDGHCYHASMTFVVPQPTTKVNLTANNLEIDDYTKSTSSYPQFMVYASTSTYNLSLDIYADSIGGTFTEADFRMMYSYVVDNLSTRYTIYSANVQVTNNAGVYTVTGTLLCYGDVEFTLNLTQSGTALDEVEGATTQGAMYDIQGRKIENPVAGQIVIRDGKKYIAR